MSRGYLPETEVQIKTGAVVKKLTDEEIKKYRRGESRWISRGRYNYMKEMGEVLDENQRVFHKDGDRKNDDPRNLVAITFNGPRYNLSHSRVLYSPPRRQAVAV